MCFNAYVNNLFHLQVLSFIRYSDTVLLLNTVSDCYLAFVSIDDTYTNDHEHKLLLDNQIMVIANIHYDINRINTSLDLCKCTAISEMSGREFT